MSARYLAPVLPLLAVPLALGVERLRRVGWGLLAVSVGLSLSAAALGLALQRHQQGNPWGVFSGRRGRAGISTAISGRRWGCSGIGCWRRCSSCGWWWAGGWCGWWRGKS